MASWTVKTFVLGALLVFLAAFATAAPPAFVQVKDFDSTLGIGTLPLTFSQPVQSGDVIVIAVGHSVPMALSISDSLGDVYVLAAPPTPGQGQLSNYATEIWYAPVVTDAGATTLTVTYQTGAYNILDIHQAEYSGLRRYGAVDSVTFASSNSSLDMDGGTIATRFPHELVFSWDVSRNTVTDAGPGFDVRTMAGADLVQDLVTDLAGDYTPTATSNDPSWMMQTVAFLPELLPDGGVLDLDAGLTTGDAGLPLPDAGTSDAGPGLADGGSPPDAGHEHPDAGTDAGIPVDLDGGTAGSFGKLGADLGCGCSQSSLPVSTLALLGLLLCRWRGRRSPGSRG